MNESKPDSKAVTTTHVCHWTINVTAIVIVAVIALVLCVSWKYIPAIMDRFSKASN